jgi:hypothetical protein
MPGYVKPPVNGRVSGTMEMIPSLATQTPLTIKGAVSQSANLLNIQNSAGTSLMTVDSSGRKVLPSQPGFLVWSASGYHGGGAWVNISTFPNSGGAATAAVSYNVGTHYNTSNGNFTVPVAGKYFFSTGGWASYNGAGNRFAFSFYVNGVQEIIGGGNTSASDSPLPSHTVIRNLAANDVVTLRMYSSVTMNLGTGSHMAYWGGHLIG